MSETGQDPKHTILEALRLRGPMRTDALVEATGLSKTATRARLLRLERDGLIARDDAAPRDAVGRPPVVYRLTDDGAEAFPVRDAALLERLLAFLEREGEGSLAERFFDELWQERTDQLRRALGDPRRASLDERLDALVDLLDAGDFMPVVDLVNREDGGRRVRIRECNCPLPAAVRATRLPCRFEARFLADAVGGRVASARMASSRGDTCLFEIDLD